MQRPTPPDDHAISWVDVAWVALLVGVGSWLSLTLTRVPSGVASVWVANGLLAGWLVFRPTRSWPAYLGAAFVAGLIARELVGDAIPKSLAFNAANLIEVLVVAGSIRRRVADVTDPGSWVALGRLGTAGTLAGCAVSGLVSGVLGVLTSGMPLQSSLLIWYPAHVIGMFLMGTLTMVSLGSGELLGPPARRKNLAASLLLVLAVAVAVFAQSRYPLLFLAYPPLLWVAFRHRFVGVIWGIAIVAVVGSIATALGQGPLALVVDVDITTRTFLLQAFLGAACLLTFPVALVTVERSRLAGLARDSEAHYRMLADYSHDVVVRLRADGQRLYVSPSSKDILGWEPAEMLEPGMVIVHPEDREIQLQAIERVLQSGNSTTATYRLRHKDGQFVWIEAVARPIPSTDLPGTMDIIFAGRDIGRRMAAQQRLEQSQRELEQLARVDSLTGLANRRQFDERLALALARSRRHQAPIALLYMDIDYFKQINDSLGHLAGDAVLKDFARRLAQCVRIEDLVARLGGDEFVMLVEDATTAPVAEAIAAKLIDCIRQPTTIDGVATSVTASIGIAFCPRATDEAELMWYADKALYVAKSAGRNRFHLVTMEETGPVARG